MYKRAHVTRTLLPPIASFFLKYCLLPSYNNLMIRKFSSIGACAAMEMSNVTSLHLLE